VTIEETINALEEAFGPFRDEDGVGWIDISAAERRLGVDLPHALQLLYTRTGRHRFHTASDKIVALSELRLEEGNWLVFYRENEETTEWAVRDLGERDPAVYGRVYSDDGDEFVHEFASVSEFLAIEAAFQGAAGGGLPVSGIIQNPQRSELATPQGRERISRAVSSPVMEPLGSARGDETRYTKGALCLISDGYFALGAKDEPTFRRIADAIGVEELSEWSFYSLRDD
jgi:hypothetical protein